MHTVSKTRDVVVPLQDFLVSEVLSDSGVLTNFSSAFLCVKEYRHSL